MNAKKTEIVAIKIVQHGGATDAATLGGDFVTLDLVDKPLFEVMRVLEPALGMPIARDATPGQLPGPSKIDGEYVYRTTKDNGLEVVPHVTLDVVNVTAGEALAQVLQQTGLGYVRTTGYLIEPN